MLYIRGHPFQTPASRNANAMSSTSAIPSSREEQLRNITDTVWTLERMNHDQALPLAERVNVLRSHYELQRLKEEDLDVPKRDRSFLYLQEAPDAAVLLVPGGHSTPAQYFQLGRHLYRSGMTVYSSLLSNEATVGAQKGGVPWQLSLAELKMRYDALALLGVPIHVVGSSFGGILSVLLASQAPVASLTLLSPPLRPHLRFGERVALASRRLFPRLFERMIAGSPHRWMADRYAAVSEADSALGGLRLPVLAIHAKDNPELGPAGLARVRRALGKQARTLLLEKGGHLLLEGVESAQVTREVQEFIQARQREAAPKAEAAGAPAA